MQKKFLFIRKKKGREGWWLKKKKPVVEYVNIRDRRGERKRGDYSSFPKRKKKQERITVLILPFIDPGGKRGMGTFYLQGQERGT